ncbi:MAG TPA: CHRD domain-containing protein, partial [Myxococcales bacterium]|nr:CHRD domain-containing protein [Myxococcales bacterium]
MRFAILLAFAAACASSKSNELGPANGPASSAPLGAAAGPSSAPGLASQGNVFRATLTAANEVPPPTVDASKPPMGTATFTVGPSSVSYSVKVTNLTSAYTA